MFKQNCKFFCNKIISYKFLYLRRMFSTLYYVLYIFFAKHVLCGYPHSPLNFCFGVKIVIKLITEPQKSVYTLLT